MPDKFYMTRTKDARDLPPPAYMSGGAAGLDLYANVGETVTIKAGETALIPTGVKIALPAGFEAQVRPRSGLALNHGVTLLNAPGTVDADYRGEIKVIVINHGREDFEVRRGARVAQMVISRVETVRFQEMDEPDFDGLHGTERGVGGFGHTGK